MALMSSGIPLGAKLEEGVLEEDVNLGVPWYEGGFCSIILRLGCCYALCWLQVQKPLFLLLYHHAAACGGVRELS